MAFIVKMSSNTMLDVAAAMARKEKQIQGSKGVETRAVTIVTLACPPQVPLRLELSMPPPHYDFLIKVSLPYSYNTKTIELTAFELLLIGDSGRNSPMMFSISVSHLLTPRRREIMSPPALL